MILPLFLPLCAALFHQAAADNEPFVISSDTQTDLTPGESTVSPLVGRGVKRTKSADYSATEDNEKVFNFDTSKEPEGKEYGYNKEGLGYGVKLDFDDREARGPHGYRYRPKEVDRKGPKTAQIKVPFIDRNGCTKVGDVVCDPDASIEGCSYNLCILENESKNLWQKPALTVSQVMCPAGRGLTADFCNQNTLLLRAAALLHTKKDKHDDEHENVHQPHYINAVDPCIIIRPACDGIMMVRAGTAIGD